MKWIMEKTSPGWFVFFAVVTVVAVGGYLYAEGKKKEKLNIDLKKLIDACWEKYVSVFSLEKEYQLYRNIFCDDGILYYMQRLAGYMKDAACWDDLQKAKQIVCDQLINGVYNVILSKGKCEKGHFVLRKSFDPDFTKEAFFLNLGIDLDNISYLPSLETILKQQIASQEKHRHEIVNASNNQYYKELWNKILPDLEDIVAYSKKEIETVPDIKELQDVMTEKTEGLVKILQGMGIGLSFYSDCTEEEREEHFTIATKGYELPMIFRKSDNYIYYGGKYVNNKNN